MALKHRLTASLATLTLGGLAALPFYRQQQSTAGLARDGQPVPASKNPSNSSIALQITAQTPKVDSAQADWTNALSPADRRVSLDTPSELKGASAVQPPPAFSRDFPSAQATVPPVSNALSRTVARPVIESDAQRSTLGTPSVIQTEVRKPTEPSDQKRDVPPVQPEKSAAHQPETEVLRQHRIRDGDTLQRLARRYLGTEDRWREILVANRDVLRDPDVLPIGKQIKIPTRQPQSESPPGSRPVPGPAAEPPLTELVPIP